ncbi:MAG: tetratricopeptide repeat protein [Methanomicrobiales archaeon]
MREFIFLIGIFDVFKGERGSLKYYKKQLSIYREYEADILIDMGVLKLENDDLENALIDFKSALKLYQKLEFTEGEAYTYNLIGDAYITARNMDKGLKHYQKSFKLYSSIRSDLKNELLKKIKETEKAKEALELINKS